MEAAEEVAVAADVAVAVVVVVGQDQLHLRKLVSSKIFNYQREVFLLLSGFNYIYEN